MWGCGARPLLAQKVAYGVSIVTEIGDLNDLERVMAVILRYFTEFGTSYVTMVEVRTCLSATKIVGHGNGDILKRDY